MPCDRDDAAVERLVSYLEKAVLELLAEYDRAQQHLTEDDYRARELLRAWLAPRSGRAQ